MSAIRLLVRSAWRRHAVASLFLAVVAGLAAAIVGASAQAATRADSSLDRFVERSRYYDVLIQGCPPGVDPEALESQEEVLEQCMTPALLDQLQATLSPLDDVERASVGSVLVVAVLQPSRPNGWGKVALLYGASTPGSPLPLGTPIVTSGRLPDPAASDEIAFGELAARAAGVRSGDVVELAGWRQQDLDAAFDGSVPPQTRPVRSTVVGIVRYLEDVQPAGVNDLAPALLPDGIYARPGWMNAHAAGFSGYGGGVAVRLGTGPTGLDAFGEQLRDRPGGWLTSPSPISDVSTGSIERVIDLERNAVLLFAAIAAVAGIGFTMPSVLRQLRRELAESSHLAALGMTRGELRLVNVLRALSLAAPACVVAVIAVVALSPLGPVGQARRLEFELGVRVDLRVLLLTIAGLVVVFGLAAFMAPVAVAAPRSRAAMRPSRLSHIVRNAGAVPQMSALVAQGRWSRVSVLVCGLGLAVAVAAGGLVASFDRVIDEPRRFGAWWDVAVGGYSDNDSVDVAAALLRANPSVVVAAAYDEQIEVVDGHEVRFVNFTDVVGESRPVMQSGRAPRADDEVALGGETARLLQKQIGDVVVVDSPSTGKVVRLNVVGIAVLNNPLTGLAGAGEGAVVPRSAYLNIVGSGSVGQSILIKVDPRLDRADAVESVRRDFSGSIREATPATEILNLSRLRKVPWLIAGLIASLAVAALVHSLVTMLGRHRSTLAILGALGFTRAQQHSTGGLASVVPVVAGVVIAIPAGWILGARLWRAVASGVYLPSGFVPAWATMVVVSVAALGAALVVASMVLLASTRVRPGEQLRAE